MGWGGNFYLICMGPAQYFWKRASETLFYIFGPFVPSLPSLLYLWHDPRISGKEKRLAPRWSGP